MGDAGFELIEVMDVEAPAAGRCSPASVDQARRRALTSDATMAASTPLRWRLTVTLAVVNLASAPRIRQDEELVRRRGGGARREHEGAQDALRVVRGMRST